MSGGAGLGMLLIFCKHFEGLACSFADRAGKDMLAPCMRCMFCKLRSQPSIKKEEEEEEVCFWP